MKVYATAAAAPTLAGVLKNATERFGIEFPLADLFAWGDDPSLAGR